MRVANDIILSETTTAAGDIYSEIVEVTYQYGFSIACVFSNTGDGFVSIEASNDGELWITVTDSVLAFVSGDTVMYNRRDVFFKYFRVKVETVNPDVTVECRFNGKGI